jgi:hypothetical protein
VDRIGPGDIGGWFSDEFSESEISRIRKGRTTATPEVRDAERVVESVA